MTQQLAETLELSDTMTRDVSIGIRSVQDYVASKRVSDLAPFYRVQKAMPLEAQRFEDSLKDVPALQKPGTTYAHNSVLVTEVLGRFLAAYRAGGNAAAQRIAREPATSALAPHCRTRDRLRSGRTAARCNNSARRAGRCSGSYGGSSPSRSGG